MDAPRPSDTGGGSTLHGALGSLQRLEHQLASEQAARPFSVLTEWLTHVAGLWSPP